MTRLDSSKDRPHYISSWHSGLDSNRYYDQIKLCSLCLGAITSTGPVCLSDLLKIYTSSRQPRSSAAVRTLCIPSVSTKSHDERSFSYTAPTLWNTLPKDIRLSQLASSFRSALKTHLFPTYSHSTD